MPRFHGSQFKYIAESLRDARPDPNDAGYLAWVKVVHTICHDLSLTNDRFNRAAFLRVSGLKKGE